MTREQKEVRNLSIKKDRLQGRSMRECAEKYGLSMSGVKHICDNLGVGGKMSNNHADYTKLSEKFKGKTKQTGQEYLEKYGFRQFACVGKYEGTDGDITVRCLMCGHEFTVQAQSIRHRTLRCQMCAKQTRINRIASAEEERKRVKAEREKWKSEKEKALAEERERRRRVAVCDICGKEFVTYDKRAKRCSDECRRKYNNCHKDKRLNAENTIDKDITLGSLYRRDSGVCYICGSKCNLEDYTVIDGTIVCGDWYPSIDHVVPLSKGGYHAWDNIRLAHRRCNTIKRDKFFSFVAPPCV